MPAALALLIMSASYFSPGFALSSHFDSDGVPLSELSWSSSLAVVAVSFSGLFTFIFLMLACLCCKKGEIGFKEFENAEGDEYQADMSTLASPASAGSPDVYVLPLSEVSLPVAKQPSRSVQLLKSTDASRHSLLYIKEIGHGWFGKVLLGEVTSGLSSTQVVVKELKTSASIQDQMHFLEEAQPYSSLQHPALVQCLAQCTEVTPYLVIMEFCPLGDVKGYLRSCRATDSMTPDPLLLQRMACQIASGLLHLHKHDCSHSDLALRNCLLTSDVTVKIGDYGLSHSKYKDDYFVTLDQSWVPLRWIAPELVDEVHGNLLVADQTKQSNIWSLGVTIWELFELGNQPYRHYSDRQVLSFAVKDQQLKLPKPLLQFPLSERWYEVMQFCWLQSDQRPNAEEVHLLLSYLCAKGASEAEEDFERRWNSMRPNTTHVSLHGAGPLTLEIPQSLTASSSFPLLEQFSAGDGYQSESGDDILTVTETSHGLNFEYKWEQARAKQPYPSSSTTGTLGQGNPHCQEVYYPPGGMVGGCGIDGLTLGVSPQFFDPKQLHTPGVVPVLSAHSPSVNSEYYIRIEEPVECHIDMEYTMCAYSPEFGGSSGSFLTGGGDSGDCMNCPSKGKPIETYWSAEIHKSSAYDSDCSPTMSLTMEPLLGQVSDSSPLRPWESGHYVSYKDRDGGYYYDNSPPLDHYLLGGPSEPMRESWGSRSLRQALGELEEPLGISPSLGSPPQGYGDPYLESSKGSVIGKNVTGGYYDMMGSLRKIMPGNHSVCIDMESGGAVFVGQDESDSEDEEDLFIERQAMSWSTNHSTKNNLSLPQRQSSKQDAYADFHYTMPMTDVEDTWPETHSLPYRSTKRLNYLEGKAKSNTCPVHGRQASVSSADCSSYIHLCHEPREAEVYPVPCCQALSNSHFVDPLTGSLVRNCFMNDNISDKNTGMPSRNPQVGQAALPTGHINSKSETIKTSLKQTEHPEYIDTEVREGIYRQESNGQQDINQINMKTEVLTITQQVEKPLPELSSKEPDSDRSRMVDSGVEHGHSSTSLVEIDNCSDDDITDVTSGIFGDFPGDYSEAADYTSPSFKSLQKQVGTPDSMDSIDLPSTVGSSETLSPTSLHPSNSPRAMDSGYDTENNESPEFVLKEPHEPQDTKTFIQPLGMSVTDSNPIMEAKEEDGVDIQQEDVDNVEEEATMKTSQSTGKLTVLSDKTPYRDSAYFSDTDAGKEKESDEDRKKGIDDPESKEEEEMQAIVQKAIPAPVAEWKGKGKSNVLETEENGENVYSGILKENQKAIPSEDNENVSPSSPEQNKGRSNVLDTEENGENVYTDIQEETQKTIPSEENENVSPSSPEQDKGRSNVLETEENGENVYTDIQEETQKAIPSEENENISPSSPEQDKGKSNVLETEENGKNVYTDIQEETQKTIPSEENENISPSSPEPNIITSISPEICECPINDTVQDEGFDLNSDEPQEGPHENHLSDLTALIFSDIKQENHKTDETGAMLAFGPSVVKSIVQDSNIENVLVSCINANEVKEEKHVTEEATSSTSSEELSAQDSSDKVEVLISDSAKNISTDNIVDKPETPEGNAKYGIQFHKSSTRPSSPPPLVSLEGRMFAVERGEPDDEDRDSEDSDESDEELRTYSIQEQSEESEDEILPVPIIVSDCSDAHKLRSLLKMPSLGIDNLGDELESKKKVVSFFDDVTVYLFDQESPTGELSEHAFPLGGETRTQGARCTESNQQEKANSTDDSSDGNISEESVGFEWDDDFSLLPLPTSSKESPPDIKAKPSLLPSATNNKPVVQFSRFTVSPSPISRFSITHVSDSDMDSAGGSSEDGDRE